MTVLLLDIKKEDSEDTIYNPIANREIRFPVGTHYAVILPYKNRNMSGGVGYSTHFNAHSAGERYTNLKKMGFNSIVVNSKGECRHVIETPNNPSETGFNSEVFYCLEDNGKQVSCVTI